MKNIEELLARNLVTRREALGLTQTELAEMAGISMRMVQNIEYQQSWPSAKTLNAIAKHLKCAPSDLLSSRHEKRTLDSDEDAATTTQHISPNIIDDGLSPLDVGPIVSALHTADPQKRALILAVLFEDPSFLEGFPDLQSLELPLATPS